MITILAVVSVGAALFCALLLWRVVREERQRSEARVAALSAAIDGPSAGTPAVAAASLFETGRTSPMQGRPLLKIAVGFVMAVGLIVLTALSTDRQPPRAAAAAAETTAAPLELLSMRHARAGESLTVTGLVRNPGEAQDGRLIAVVLAFDRAGDFVASGRAPLEFPRLGRGDESPFQVIIGSVPDVGRYRVSFRTESGVVRHVDLREGADRRIAAK